MPPYTSWGTFKGLFIILFIVLFLLYMFGSPHDLPDFNSHRGHSPVFKALLQRNRNFNSSTRTSKSQISKTNGTTERYSSTQKQNKTSNVITNSNNISRNSSRSGSDLNNLFTSPTNSSSVNSSSIGSSVSMTSNVTTNSSQVANSTGLPLCPEVSPELRGRIPVVLEPVPSITELEKNFSWLKPGGHWQPETCKVLKKVAIIIPFRCRGKHLLLFLRHMHPFLKRQQIDYTIFIVEQDGNGPFNRAMLMNIGFKEAMKTRNFDCFIFHDIDLLPENDNNLYSCPEQPRHMSVAVDIFHYKLPYPTIFGGVSAITRKHFELLNGFSNSFWGWGGEDDDMANRIKYHNLYVSRYPPTIARYTMLSHKKDNPSPNRYEILSKGAKMYDKDGLNNLKYELLQKKENLLYTWILVEIHPLS